jgi:hypothetical protein
MRRKGIFRVAAFVLVVPLLLGVASADAKKKHKKPKSPPVTVVSATQTTSDDGQRISVTATCPAGQLAVGGGFKTPILLSGASLNDLHVIYESRRIGDNAWQSSGVREHGSGAAAQLPLTTSVDCRTATLTKKRSKKAASAAKKKKKRLRISEVSAAGPSATTGELSTATASCPAGTQAIGGGFSSAPDPSTTGQTSFPLYYASLRSSPTSWFSAFINSGVAAHAVTSYAYCAAGLKLTETSGAAALPASSNAGLQSATAASPNCPKGRALLGGGFSSTTPDPVAGGPILFMTELGPAARSWHFSAFNFSAVAGNLTAQGICA